MLYDKCDGQLISVSRQRVALHQLSGRHQGDRGEVSGHFDGGSEALTSLASFTARPPDRTGFPNTQEGFISFDEEGRNTDLSYFPPTWTFQRHRDARTRPPLCTGGLRHCHAC